jgi:hypothetical protein
VVGITPRGPHVMLLVNPVTQLPDIGYKAAEEFGGR